ncbi:MAG TPA: LruC domain-containing protein [Spirochaetota bacterium]|nr:LruC domain-containing protein [Spirochaetota bacterium]HPJ36011.1 LruC domain-containing protein [Spirochaetota bacterium]
MNKILILIILVMFAFSCGGSGGGSASGSSSGDISVNDIADETVTASITAEAEVESINDVVRDEPVLSSTVSVDFELTVLGSAGEPLANAIITLVDETGAAVTSAVTDENGFVVFTSLLEKDDTIATIVIAAEGYDSREISVSDIGSLEAVIRTIALEVSAEPVAWTDTDSDGIPDELDAFPTDSELAFTANGKFIIAFDGEYPEKGDSDFNDYVVKLQITESINNKNEVVGVSIHTVPVESDIEAGNTLGIYIKGERYILSVGSVGVSVRPTKFNVVFPVPVPRSEIQLMPYDPFLIPGNDSSRGEIHLPFVETVYDGAVAGEDGLPWVIIIPEGWKSPEEGSSVADMYPEFEAWYLSGGAEYSDWYLNPAE